jgi:cytidylate kinase
MAVITILRQDGSLGDEIAAAVAERLKLRLVDSDIINEVAARLGVSPSSLTAIDDRDEGLVVELVRTMRRLYPATRPPGAQGEQPEIDESEYVGVVRQVIEEVARTGDAVIVGRGAAFVLPPGPGLLHVLIVAPFDARLKRTQDTARIGQRAASQHLHQDDHQRARYIKHYYRADWLDPVHYDLVLNTGTLQVAQAADLVVEAVRLIQRGVDTGTSAV